MARKVGAIKPVEPHAAKMARKKVERAKPPAEPLDIPALMRARFFRTLRAQPVNFKGEIRR